MFRLPFLAMCPGEGNTCLAAGFEVSHLFFFSPREALCCSIKVIAGIPMCKIRFSLLK